MGTTPPTHLLHNSPMHTVMPRDSGALPENPEHPCLSSEYLDSILWPGSVEIVKMFPPLGAALLMA